MIKQVGDTLHAATSGEAIVALVEVVNTHAKHIRSLERANKRLAFAVLTLSAAGYLAWRYAYKLSTRVDALERKGEPMK